MASRSTTQTITYDSASSKYHVHYEGKTIETTVTNKATITEQWVNEILLAHANEPMVVVGLHVECRPLSMSSKYATLQLCIDTKCIILQLFYMDEIPKSLKSFLLNPRFTFVGIGIENDILKLKNGFGLDCSNRAEIQCLDLNDMNLRFTSLDVLWLCSRRMQHIFLNNWESRVLSANQVECACIDVFGLYKFGHKYLIEEKDDGSVLVL